MSVISVTWTGANAAAWPSTFTTSGGAGSAFDIQSNQGRMTAPTTTFTASRAWYGTAANLDMTITIVIPNPKVESYIIFNWRGDDWASGTSGNAANGYQCELGVLGNALDFYSTAANVRTYISSPGFTFVNGTTVKLRVRAIGQSHKMKVWTATSAEPDAWTISATDATYAASNQWGFAFASSTANGTQAFDDLYGETEPTVSTLQSVRPYRL